MGKKVKSKGKNPRKVHPRMSSSTPSSSPRAAQPDMIDPEAEAVAENEVGGEACKHYDKGGPELNKVLLKVRSSNYSSSARCDDCREDVANRRGNKGKGKGSKKKGGPSAAAAEASGETWVCLSCGHHGCGGGVDVSVPYGHARRHSKQERHSLAVRADDPLVCWCYPCDTLITIEMPPDEPKVEVKQAKDVSDYVVNGGETMVLDCGKGYSVRGLVNLGNTCFFNSVMQNLFAMTMVREYFSSMAETVGPLTASLKKLYVETGGGVETNKNIVNPRNLFGSICSKAPQFKGYQQQDSHELLRYLLDGLCVEELSYRKSLNSCGEEKTTMQAHSTFVDTIFGGLISSTVCCVECGHTSVVLEPFLDLSLPLPAKKIPTKVSANLQKKNKLQIREGTRNRRTRDRPVKLPPLEQHRSGNFVSSSECREQTELETVNPSTENSESYCSADCGKEVPSVSAEVNDTWLDFIGPIVNQDDTDLASQGLERSALEDSELEDFSQRDNDVQPAPELLTDASSKERIVALEDCGEDNSAPLKLEDSKSRLFPDNKVALSLEKNIGARAEPHKHEIVAENDNSSTKSNAGMLGCEPPEPEFVGLGDLFDEKEDISYGRVENGIDDDTSWYDGFCSESTQVVVDNTDALISVNNCLAYFTKAELLSDEHAWHCENCSKILQRQILERRKSKQLAIERGQLCEASFSEASVSRGKSKVDLPSLNDDTLDSSEHKALANGKFATSSGDVISNMENHRDANVDVETNVNPAGIIATNCKTCNSRDAGNEKCSKLSKSSDSCVENCEISEKCEVVEESDTSQYFSCSSSIENNNTHVNSGNSEIPDTDSCSRDEKNDDAPEIESLPFDSNHALYNGEANKARSCANGMYSTAPNMKRKDKILPRVKNDEERGEPEPVKVKRDATKRMLIKRVPPILTIHLKRFSQDARGRLNKMNGHVSFQEVLDLAPYIDPRCGAGKEYKYRLLGVVEHSGNMRGGHYVAYVRGDRKKTAKEGTTDTWFYASDAHVREASLAEVLHSEAYILFYEKI